MGCRLPKLQKAEERRSPGNIYSTLRRPQVETKVGVAYTYHFLDFLLGKEEVSVSSVLCLSSVRELPVQVRELYAQGFVLVSVHPFVHPCGPRHAHLQRQLHRAVLVRETPSSEKNQLRWGRHCLETDVCVAGHQSADPEAIQSYVKRIQDVAEQGVMFVGFLQQPGGAPCFLGHWDPDELSSLHSSPSPIHRHPFSAKTSPTESHDNNLEHDCHRFNPQELDRALVKPDPISESGEQIQSPQVNLKDSTHSKPVIGHAGQWCQITVESRAIPMCPRTSEPAEVTGQLRDQPEIRSSDQRERQSSSSDSWPSSPELDPRRYSSGWTDGRVTTHNNNHIQLKGSEKHNRSSPPTPSEQARMQLFALYNHSEELNTSLRFYSLRVPLQVQKEAGLITDVDTHWLDHMTHHFTSGALLVDGFFHLEGDNDNGVSTVDSVFIFQSSAEETANTAYDAIVVEQWTVVDRPVLQRKRKDFKFQMLNLRGRSKTKKKSAGGIQVSRENPVIETEMDRLRGSAEEGERGKIWNSESSKGGSPQNRGENGGEHAEHRRAFSFIPGSRAFDDEEQEEETDIDKIPPSEQKPVKCTYVFRRDDGGGVKEEVKMEERIKRQLFSGVC